MAMTGQDYLFSILMDKLLAKLPPETVDNIRQVAQTVADFRAQLDRIEQKQDLILHMANSWFNSPVSIGMQNVGHPETNNGSGTNSGSASISDGAAGE